MTLDNRHTVALPYWARPGFRLFAKPADEITAGADEDEEEDEDEGEEDDDPDAEKSEDELRAELKAIRNSLRTANGQSKSKREKLRKLQAELDAARAGKPKKKTDDDDDELDVESIREQARREGEKAGNDRVKRAELRTALAKAGVTDDKALARLARMVELDNLDVDDDGNVDGIEEAIDELRGDLPDLFARPRRKRPGVTGPNDRDGDRGDRDRSKAKSASQKAADKLLGRG